MGWVTPAHRLGVPSDPTLTFGPMTLSIQFREHPTNYEEYDYWGRWFTETWVELDPGKRPQPYTFGEPPFAHQRPARHHSDRVWQMLETGPERRELAYRLDHEMVLPAR